MKKDNHTSCHVPLCSDAVAKFVVHYHTNKGNITMDFIIDT